jgi:hypothetical protein
MGYMRTTVTDITRMIPTEAAAYEYMESLCWPDGVICPHCGCTDATYIAPTNGVPQDAHRGNVGASGMALLPLP